jgi:hypothetical protein
VRKDLIIAVRAFVGTIILAEGWVSYWLAIFSWCVNSQQPGHDLA